VIWAVLWVAFGLLVARDVREMGRITDTVVRITSGLKLTTDALKVIETLPLVGGSVGNLDQIVTQADREAKDTQASFSRVSVYAGIALAVLPTVLLLAIYAPFRIPWSRAANSVRRARAADPEDPLLAEYLARRAVDRLTLDELRAISANPWRDIANGEFGPLAQAELVRLGVQ
jgi:hypothetical protein